MDETDGITWDVDPEWSRKYGSPERVRWVQNSRSVVSGRTPCVNAHVTPDEGLPVGTGRKAGYQWIVPLTDEEHREHHRGEVTFQRRHRINLADAARETQQRWERYNRRRAGS